MTKALLRPAAVLLLALACGVPGRVPAEAADYGGQPRSPVLASRFAAEPYGRCDRVEVRDCQADAALDLDLCGPFGGKLACAGETLVRLRQCWAATGCW